MVLSSDSPKKIPKRNLSQNNSQIRHFVILAICITNTILFSHCSVFSSSRATRLPVALAFGIVNYANSKRHNHQRNLYLDDENSFDRSQNMNTNLDNFDLDEEEDFDEYCLVFDDFGCEAFENVTKYPANNNQEEVKEESSTSSKIKNSMPSQENRKEEESKLKITSNDASRINENKKDIADESTILQWIRLQARPDQVLKDMQTVDQIWNKIDHVKNTQSSHGKADLYKRYWTPLASTTKEVQGYKKINKRTHMFSVLQFNTLAEGLSSGPEAKTPFAVDPQKAKGNNFGGFTQINFPELVLNFAQRRWRLLEVLLRKPQKHGDKNEQAEINDDACKESSIDQQDDGIDDDELFDLIAMEEIDRYRGFFKPVLRLFGYHGVFMPKPKAPGIRLGWYSDGCALFYNKRKFELVSSNPGEYKVGTQVFIICTLLHRASGKSIVVAVTHLKAQRSETNEIIRTAQITELLQNVEDMANLATTTTKGTAGNEKALVPPILIMGDLNADPPSITGQGGCVERVLESGQYKSVYPLHETSSASKLFTTWKTRGESTVQRVIDYIFYSSNGDLICTDKLSIPEEEDVAADGYLPSLRYPSDHLAIGAQFELEDDVE